MQFDPKMQKKHVSPHMSIAVYHPLRTDHGQAPAAASLSGRRQLEPDRFAFFADGQLNRTSDDPAFGGPLGLTLPNKELTVGTEAMTALMALEALVMPLPADG